MTERARAEACRQVGEQNRSVACVARDFGVGWSTVMAAVYDYGRPRVDDPGRLAGTTALGLDEVAFLRANAHRHTVFATNIVDLVRGRLLDVVAGRSGRAVHDWLGTRPHDWLAGVGTVAIDPFRGYANGVATHLGHATLVVDPFHAVAVANRAIDDVRRRVQQDTLGHRGRSGDPLYGIRRLLLRGTERLNERSRARLELGLAAGDPLDEVLDTLLAKEAFRWSYAADDIAEAARRFDAFIAECKASNVPRAPPCGAHRRALAGRDSGPPPHRRIERAHGGGQSHRQEGPTRRPWLPQLRELPPESRSPLWRGMAHSSCRTNQRPLSPGGRVEPSIVSKTGRRGRGERGGCSVFHSTSSKTSSNAASSRRGSPCPTRR
jgi:hypothetical protein